MPQPQRTTVLSFFGFVIVLALALCLRPMNVPAQDAKISTSVLNSVENAINFTELGDGEYGVVIGIELGRTYYRVGLKRNNTFQIIPDEFGRTVVPSYVSFPSQGGCLVGFEAMEQVANNLENTIYDVRLLMGRKFLDSQFQDDIRHLPYNVVENNGFISVKIQKNGADEFFTLEEISAKIFEKLKDMAQQYLQRKVAYAVVAVPAHFDDVQRQHTKDAATIADLSVLRLVNEPTAAGIAHGLEIHDKESFDIIYHLGAKESHVALLNVENGVFEILAKAQNSDLGGDDFENPLLSHVLNQIETQNLIDIETNPKVYNLLMSEVIRAEAMLATEQEATIQMSDQHFSMFITEDTLAEVQKQLGYRAIQLVNQVFDHGKMAKAEINQLILTGDPIHVSKLRPILEEYLEGKNIPSIEGTQSDEVIVHGAAIQAAVLEGIEDDLCTLSFPKIFQLNLGIETSGDVFTKIIPRYTHLPTRRRRSFTTAMEGQDKVVIKILEGVRARASKNTVLGTLELTGLPLNAVLDVEFEVDENENVSVVAKQKDSSQQAKLVIRNHEHRPTWEQAEQMLMDAKKYWDEDQLMLEEQRNKNPGDRIVANFGLAHVLD